MGVGSLVPRKRFVEMAQAFEPVDGTLIIVGDGGERARLTADGVRCMGRLDHDALREVLRASDVFVHAAGDAAFGLAVAEAQAVGLPAIVMAHSGPAELVEDGRTGYVVSPDDLTDAMQRQMPTVGIREHIITKFSIETTKRRYQELYASLK